VEADASSTPSTALPTCEPALAPDCTNCSAYERLNRQMIGRWQGRVDDPAAWASQTNGTVQLVLRADGGYSVACSDGCIVMYYGENTDDRDKRWELLDIWHNGQGYGEIDVTFEAGTVSTHDLRHIALSATGSELTFEQWNDRYGPRVFHLTRCAGQ